MCGKSLQLQLFQPLDWDIYLIINVRVFIKNSSNSRTSRKRPPKMQRLGGRLGEVVAYESQTARAKALSQPRME